VDRKRVDEVRHRTLRDVNIHPMPAAPGAPRRSAVMLRDGGSNPTPPLFLVPGQLGQIFHFKRVAERLRDDIPIVGFESVGLYGDEPPLDTIDAIADRFIEEMRAIQPRGPHLLGGFSAGVIVAYVMAAKLEAQGDPPHLLILDYGPGSDRRRTGIQARLLASYDWWRFHLQNYRGLEDERRAAYKHHVIGQLIRRNTRRLRLNPDGPLYTWWLNRRAQQRPDRVPLPGDAAVRSALRTARRQFEWGDVVFHQPFTLFRAKIQGLGKIPDGTLGFDETTAPGGVEVRHLPGKHEFMFIEPHVYTLIPEIEDWVDAAVAASSPIAREPAASTGG
jgi:thioesterase domain-containing protein